MTIQEAIKSGKPFKRPSWGNWLSVESWIFKYTEFGFWYNYAITSSGDKRMNRIMVIISVLGLSVYFGLWQQSSYAGFAAGFAALFVAFLVDHAKGDY